MKQIIKDLARYFKGWFITKAEKDKAFKEQVKANREYYMTHKRKDKHPRKRRKNEKSKVHR